MPRLSRCNTARACVAMASSMTNASDRYFVLIIHHAIFDGWSLNLVILGTFCSITYRESRHASSAAVLWLHQLYSQISIQVEAGQRILDVAVGWGPSTSSISTPTHFQAPLDSVSRVMKQKNAVPPLDQHLHSQRRLSSVPRGPWCWRGIVIRGRCLLWHDYLRPPMHRSLAWIE